jgi:hypothetical protein
LYVVRILYAVLPTFFFPWPAPELLPPGDGAAVSELSPYVLEPEPPVPPGEGAACDALFPSVFVPEPVPPGDGAAVSELSP